MDSHRYQICNLVSNDFVKRQRRRAGERGGLFSSPHEPHSAGCPWWGVLCTGWGRGWLPRVSQGGLQLDRGSAAGGRPAAQEGVGEHSASGGGRLASSPVAGPAGSLGLLQASGSSPHTARLVSLKDGHRGVTHGLRGEMCGPKSEPSPTHRSPTAMTISTHGPVCVTALQPPHPSGCAPAPELRVA